MKIFPEISVIMPVYNSGEYIRDSITSILQQSYQKFELIIINDGSTDKSLQIIENFKKKDERIILINRNNKGIVHSLNEGIEFARGQYIARMDADDISLPNRFEEQINFLKNNDVDVVGTWVQKIQGGKKLSITKYPEKHNDIFFGLFFKSNFSHPAVMLKKKVFKDVKYSNETAEDYRLWCDLALKKFKFANLQKILLYYRVHEKQLTKLKKDKNHSSSKKISLYFSQRVDNQIHYLLNNYYFSLMKDSDVFSDFFDKIFLKLNQYKVSSNFSKDLLYHIYNNLQHRNLYFYLIFYNKTKNYKKNLHKKLN